MSSYQQYINNPEYQVEKNTAGQITRISKKPQQYVKERVGTQRSYDTFSPHIIYVRPDGTVQREEYKSTYYSQGTDDYAKQQVYATKKISYDEQGRKYEERISGATGKLQVGLKRVVKYDPQGQMTYKQKQEYTTGGRLESTKIKDYEKGYMTETQHAVDEKVKARQKLEQSKRQPKQLQSFVYKGKEYPMLGKGFVPREYQEDIARQVKVPQKQVDTIGMNVRESQEAKFLMLDIAKDKINMSPKFAGKLAKAQSEYSSGGYATKGSSQSFSLGGKVYTASGFSLLKSNEFKDYAVASSALKASDSLIKGLSTKEQRQQWAAQDAIKSLQYGFENLKVKKFSSMEVQKVKDTMNTVSNYIADSNYESKLRYYPFTTKKDSVSISKDKQIAKLPKDIIKGISETQFGKGLGFAVYKHKQMVVDPQMNYFVKPIVESIWETNEKSKLNYDNFNMEIDNKQKSTLKGYFEYYNQPSLKNIKSLEEQRTNEKEFISSALNYPIEHPFMAAIDVGLTVAFPLASTGLRTIGGKVALQFAKAGLLGRKTSQVIGASRFIGGVGLKAGEVALGGYIAKEIYQGYKESSNKAKYLGELTAQAGIIGLTASTLKPTRLDEYYSAKVAGPLEVASSKRYYSKQNIEFAEAIGDTALQLSKVNVAPKRQLPFEKVAGISKADIMKLKDPLYSNELFYKGSFAQSTYFNEQLYREFLIERGGYIKDIDLAATERAIPKVNLELDVKGLSEAKKIVGAREQVLGKDNLWQQSFEEQSFRKAVGGFEGEDKLININLLESTTYKTPMPKTKMEREVLEYVFSKGGYAGGSGALYLQFPKGKFRSYRDWDIYFPSKSTPYFESYVKDITQITSKYGKFNLKLKEKRLGIFDKKGKEIFDIGIRSQNKDYILTLPSGYKVRSYKQIIDDKKQILRVVDSSESKYKKALKDVNLYSKFIQSSKDKEFYRLEKDVRDFTFNIRQALSEGKISYTPPIMKIEQGISGKTDLTLPIYKKQDFKFTEFELLSNRKTTQPKLDYLKESKVLEYKPKEKLNIASKSYSKSIKSRPYVSPSKSPYKFLSQGKSPYKSLSQGKSPYKSLSQSKSLSKSISQGKSPYKSTSQSKSLSKSLSSSKSLSKSLSQSRSPSKSISPPIFRSIKRNQKKQMPGFKFDIYNKKQKTKKQTKSDLDLTSTYKPSLLGIELFKTKGLTISKAPTLTSGIGIRLPTVKQAKKAKKKRLSYLGFLR